MPTILVVEDNPIVARDLQNTLRRLGYAAPMVVASGEEAVEEAVTLAPDLVLMDVGLSGDVDGIEAAHAIRARVDVPVVFMTALSDDATLQRAWKTEPFGYVLKPLEPRALRAAVEMALYAHRTATQQRERERSYAAALRAVRDAVVTAGVDLRVTFANPAAEALVGRPREALVGKPLGAVVALHDASGPVDVDARCAEALAAGAGAGVALPEGATLVREDGQHTRVEGSLQAAEGAGGLVVVLREVGPAR